MPVFDYVHVDVFTEKPLGGNGLTVVFCDRFFSDVRMLDLAREFKQFETIFLCTNDGRTVDARIFTVDGELPFAGHPALGAAVALHDRLCPGDEEACFTLMLQGRLVPVTSTKRADGFSAMMRQGIPSFLGVIPPDQLAWLAAAHGLLLEDLDDTLPPEVVSTGLPYLLLPVKNCLYRARIAVRDLEERIAVFGASYTYLLDADALQARTWDNLGLVEDSATGSAAGPTCAYLIKHGRLSEGHPVTIRQGRYANRPGFLRAWMEASEVFVAGDVAFFARGTFALEDDEPSVF